MTYTEAILSALEGSGRSDRDVSLEAVGHESAVRSLKRGVDTRASTLKALCDVLGLEFYVGPPRGDPGTTRDKAPARDESPAPDIGAFRDQLAGMQTDFLDRLSEATAAVEALAAAPDDHADHSEARPVKVMEIEGSAGFGMPIDLELVSGHVWFRHDWLRANSLNPERCRIIRVTGNSMEPTLTHGCSILVDHSSIELQNKHIYAIRGEDGLIIKRVKKDEKTDHWMAISDNDDYDPIPWTERMDVVGEIRWMARKLPR